ncbi:hypothetical protein O1157_17980 [Streptomyces albogriseolus]
MTSSSTTSSGNARTRPASANSGTQVTSRFTTSYSALRDCRAPSSWLRCSSALPGSSTSRARYCEPVRCSRRFQASMSCCRTPFVPVTSRPLATTMVPGTSR